MFPYTAPAGIPEVNRFMTGIGAGTRTTAPGTWLMGGGLSPTTVHYYCTTNMGAGRVFKWVDGEGESDDGRNIIEPRIINYLIEHYKLRAAHQQQSLTALAFNQVAQEIRKAGLPGTTTVEAMFLHSIAYKVHGHPELAVADNRYVRGIVNCAAWVSDPTLSRDDRLDRAVSGVDDAIIAEMTAKGIPLNLITDLYSTW